MKSRINAPKSMVASLEQEVYAATVEACEDNNAFFLLALNQEFGFGPERLRRVIHRYNELSEEYSVMREDGFTYEEIHDRMCEALESIGIDPDQVYVGKNDFYDMQRKKRMVEKERLPSVKEARQASDHLEAFRAFMAAEGKDIAGKSIMKDFMKGDITNEVRIKRQQRFQACSEAEEEQAQEGTQKREEKGVDEKAQQAIIRHCCSGTKGREERSICY